MIRVVGAVSKGPLAVRWGAAPDPAPFRASWRVLAAVTPGFNWLALARGGADKRTWQWNLGLLLVDAEG